MIGKCMWHVAQAFVSKKKQRSKDSANKRMQRLAPPPFPFVVDGVSDQAIKFSLKLYYSII